MTRTCLVLSGGGSRGAYQAGCWRALDEAGLRPEAIVGTSIGALNGAAIAQGMPWEDLWALWSSLRQKDILRVRRDVWRFWRWTGVYDEAPMRGRLEEVVDLEAVRRDGRLRVCAVDLRTGIHRVFHGPDLQFDHFLGSAALVPAVPPVRVGDMLLADGGLAHNPALLVGAETGARRIVALLHDPVADHPGQVEGPRALGWRASDVLWHHRLRLERDQIRARRDLPRRHPMHLATDEITFLAPSTPIPGDMLRFDPAKARGLLDQGYQEALAALR